MKIWQIDPAQLTPYYNIAVCNALSAVGCKVRYITSRYLYDSQLTDSLGFETVNLYFRGMSSLRWLQYPRLRHFLRGMLYPLGHWEVARLAQQEHPDLVHIQWSRLPRYDVWLIYRLNDLNIPVIHTVHDVVPLFDLERGSDPFAKIYTAVTGLIVHTEANRKDLFAHYPILDARRVHIVPLIHSDNTMVPPRANREQARKSLGLPPDAPVCLFFGSIRSYKAVDILAEAYEKAVLKLSDLHLIVAGRPDNTEQAQLVKQLAVHPNVHVCLDYIPYGDVWKYYFAADVSVFPYRHIYQSAALITAMGFGHPVIVTNVGGLPETVDGNGWIVPPEDAYALAEALVEAASDRERSRRMGLRSRQLIEERHSGPTVADALVHVYRDALGEAAS